MQTRKGSLLESVVNVAIGYGVALLSQIVVFPIVGVQASLKQNVTTGLFFTGISVLRSYTVRRLFNRLKLFTVPR